MNRSALRDQVAFEAVRMLPKGLFSDAVGWGARRRVPAFLRGPLYRSFARVVGADLAEVEGALGGFDTFGDFFARPLRRGARPLASAADALAGPCDGIVGAMGTATDGELLQAKGHRYTVADLLVDAETAGLVADGPYITVYLSPRDYHRVHVPVDASWLGYDYVPGTQYPVNPTWVARQPNLFASNERLVFHLQTQWGRFAQVMVGATGVGNMRLCDGVETRTFRGQPGPVRVRFDQPRTVTRGAELGSFQLGSTVILLFPPECIRLDVRSGHTIRWGQAIGRVLPGTQAVR